MIEYFIFFICHLVFGLQASVRHCSFLNNFRLRETRDMISRPSSVRLTFYIFVIYVIPIHVDSFASGFVSFTLIMYSRIDIYSLQKDR